MDKVLFDAHSIKSTKVTFSFLKAKGRRSKSSILHVPFSCISKIGSSFNNYCISAFPFRKLFCLILLSYSTFGFLSITFLNYAVIHLIHSVAQNFYIFRIVAGNDNELIACL